jgi:hypothetical protein
MKLDKADIVYSQNFSALEPDNSASAAIKEKGDRERLRQALRRGRFDV